MLTKKLLKTNRTIKIFQLKNIRLRKSNFRKNIKNRIKKKDRIYKV